MLVVIIILALVFMGLWFVLWRIDKASALLQMEEEQSKALLRYNNQVKKIWNEGEKLKEEIEKLISANQWYITLLEKYQDRYWPFKLTIEETYKQQIVELYKEWKTQKEIAEMLWCGKSTIQRAIKKRWLKR